MMKNIKLLYVFFAVLSFVLLQDTNSQVYQSWIQKQNGSSASVDEAAAIVTDAGGNVYVTGFLTNTTSGRDCVTYKYGTAGNLLWTAVYNYNNFGDMGADIIVDNTGNVYVACTSGLDYATIKYNSLGVQQWVSRYNGTANNIDQATAITVDQNGNVYTTGYCSNTGTSYDYVTVKYNSAGTQLWAAVFNGAANFADVAWDLAVDAGGNVFVTGQSSNGTNDDYATVKYNSSGIQQWAKIYNGPANSVDYSFALKLDAAGDIYITGNSAGISNDYATIKYNSAGTELWVQRYNGPVNGVDYALDISVDNIGGIYVTGASVGSATGTDYATIRYSTTGSQLWVVRHNGPANSNDFGTNVTADSSGNCYVTGYTRSSSGGFDFTTIKYNISGTQQWIQNYNGSANDTDKTTAIAVDRYGMVYVAGTSEETSNGFDYTFIKYSQPPPGPPLIAPLNNATGVPVTPLFDWTDIPNTNKYWLRVSTSPLLINPVISDSSLTSSQFAAAYGVLALNTTYYWQVHGINQAGIGNFYQKWNFTTTPNPPPAAPVLVSPPNGSTGQSLTPLLNWNDVSGATSYSVQVSVNPSFSTTIVNQTGLATSQYTVPLGLLQNNVTYYWRANAGSANGSGPWSSAWSFVTGLVGVQLLGTEIPKEYSLFDNYPNPFNPVTNIEFSLPEFSSVKLVVFNILGKEIGVPVNEQLNAGTYRAEWNAADYPSGVYFYRIKTDGFTDTKKMILIK